MSDMDESGFDGSADPLQGYGAQQHSGGGGGGSGDEDDAALEAAAEAAYEAKLAAQRARGGDGDEDEEERFAAERAAASGEGGGFSSDDEGGAAAGESLDEGALGGDFSGEQIEYEGGDPSSIHAPAGSSTAASEAAARLARLMAEEENVDVGSDGEGGEEDDEARQARKREIAQLEAQLRASSSARSSHRSGRSGAVHEEKEFGEDRRGSNRVSQAASQRHTHRSGGAVSDRSAAAAASAAAPVDDLAGLEDELAGLDDDGMYEEGSDYDGAGDEGSDFESGRGAGERDDGAPEEEIRTMEDVARAKEEREHLIEVNKIRQRQIALILEREKQGPGGKGPASRSGLHTSEEKSHGDGGAPPEQIRAEYIKNLENLNLLWDELEAKREEAEDKIDRLTAKLDTADEKASELSDSFKSFKREICKEARFSRTGKPIKLKRILAFEAAEETMDREVARVRLRHINLLNELHALEASIRAKEKLAEGLHLIDFEQLKIENQTLNEKIEERNDELHKLKKKTTTTVQVLTHIKEKLQCVREENALAQGELASLNEGVQDLRDALTKMKHIRDQTRFENQVLKQKQGFIGSDLLVSDFENRKGEIEILRGEVDALKARWRSLTQLVQRAQTAERNHARGGGGASSLASTQVRTGSIRYGGGASSSNSGLRR